MVDIISNLPKRAPASVMHSLR